MGQEQDLAQKKNQEVNCVPVGKKQSQYLIYGRLNNGKAVTWFLDSHVQWVRTDFSGVTI